MGIWVRDLYQFALILLQIRSPFAPIISVGWGDHLLRAKNEMVTTINLRHLCQS